MGRTCEGGVRRPPAPWEEERSTTGRKGRQEKSATGRRGSESWRSVDEGDPHIMPSLQVVGRATLDTGKLYGASYTLSYTLPLRDARGVTVASLLLLASLPDKSPAAIAASAIAAAAPSEVPTGVSVHALLPPAPPPPPHTVRRWWRRLSRSLVLSEVRWRRCALRLERRRHSSGSISWQGVRR